MALALLGVAYNVDLFNQLGVKVPTTFAQVIDACRKISAAGKVPFAFPAADSTGAGDLAYMLSASTVYASDPTFNVKRQAGKISFATSAGWRRTLQQIVEMRSAGCFSPGAITTLQPQAAAAFATGDAAMYTLQTQRFSQFLVINPKMNFGVFAMPADKSADTRIMINSTGIVGVNAATTGETRDAALKFIDFIARPKQQQTFDNAIGALLTPEQLRLGQIPSLWPQLTPMLPYLKRPSPIIPAAIWPNAQTSAALVVAIQGLFTGQKTVDQGLADLDTAFNLGRGGGK
jgi:raffinose/stachyose/melibiose transport system substrate-binding protein